MLYASLTRITDLMRIGRFLILILLAGETSRVPYTIDINNLSNTELDRLAGHERMRVQEDD